MAESRQETHVWFDGISWAIYTERPSHARRFETLFGTPNPRASTATGARQVWNWTGIPKPNLRINRKRNVQSRQVAPSTLTALQAGKNRVVHERKARNG